MLARVTMPTATALPNATLQAELLEAAVRDQLSKNLGLNLGPFLLGLAFDTTLFGMMLHQLICWFSYSRKDRVLVKVCLAVAVTVTTATTCYNMAYIFHLFVYSFGRFTTFIETNWMEWLPLLDVLSTFPVQSFYLHRAYILNHNALWVPVLVLPIMFAGVAGGIAVVITGRQLASFVDFGSISKYVYLGLASELGADLIITSLILYGLWQNRTGWSGTDWLINKLIRISIQSQLLSTLVAIGLLINYGVESGSFMLIYWEMWHPKCYVVSMLAVLNSSYSLKREGTSLNDDSNGVKRNSFGSKPHQATVQLDTITVDTSTYAESNKSPPSTRGLNRSQPGYEELGLDNVMNSSQVDFAESRR